jgi:hypothetical protein
MRLDAGPHALLSFLGGGLAAVFRPMSVSGCPLTVLVPA